MQFSILRAPAILLLRPRDQIPCLLSEVMDANAAGRAEGDRDDPNVALDTLMHRVE